MTRLYTARLPKADPKPKKDTTVTFDLETFLISPGIQAPPIAGLGFKVLGERSTHVVMGGDPALYRVMRSLLEDRSVRLVGQHVRFDLACLSAYEPEWLELIAQKLDDDGVGCTLLADCLIRIAKANPMENPMEENLPYNLAQSYKLYVNGGLNVDKEDPWRLRWGTLAKLPLREVLADPDRAQAIRYLKTDVEATEAVWVAQHQRYSTWLLDLYRQVRASVMLYYMQAWGVKTDPQQVSVLADHTRKILDDAAKECEIHGLVDGLGKRDIKAASSAQERAYARLGLEVPRGKVTPKMAEKVFQRALKAGTKEGLDDVAAADRARAEVEALKGNVKLDEEACRESRDPLMADYSTYSQASLLLGKVRRLGKPLIQASYNTIVNTGRTSCRSGDDPKKGFAPSAWGSQMQNPPRDNKEPCVCRGHVKDCPKCKGAGEISVPGVREAYVARPGHVLISIDFDAFEMRTWAQVCLWMVGFSKLADILNDPKRCPHIEMGARILKILPEVAYGWKKIEGQAKELKRLRNLAKGPNFGLPGGMGAERLVAYCWDNYGVELDPDPEVALEKAQEIIKVWKEIYPEAPEYLQLISRIVNGGECFQDEETGKKKYRARIVHHYSARVRGGVAYCDAANSFFQGLASDAAKASLWAIWKAMYADRKSCLYGSRPIAFVHDELLAEVPVAKVDGIGLHERALELQRLWVGEAQKVVPDVLISASPAASYRWSKAAGDPVYNSQGRLMPYELKAGYSGLPAPEGQLEAWYKHEAA